MKRPTRSASGETVRLSCPSCGEALRGKPGRAPRAMVRCPTCDFRFPPGGGAADAPVYEEAPTSEAPPPASAAVPWLVGGIVVLALLLAVTAVVIVGLPGGSTSGGEASRKAADEETDAPPPDELQELKRQLAAERLQEAESKKKVANLLADAREAKETRKFDQAVRYYEEALELNPASQVAKLGLEHSLRAKEEADKSERDLSEKLNRATQAEERGDHAAAALAYSDVLAIKPDHAVATRRFAAVQVVLQKKVIVVNEGQYVLHITEANRLLAALQYAAALDAFRKALAIKPGDKAAHDGLTKTAKEKHNDDLFSEGNRQKAEKEKLDEARKKDEEAQRLAQAERDKERNTRLLEALAAADAQAEANRPVPPVVQGGSSTTIVVNPSGRPKPTYPVPGGGQIKGGGIQGGGQARGRPGYGGMPK